MGFYLDTGSEFGRYCALKPVGHFVRGLQRKLAIDLEIKRDRKPVLELMDSNMMHSERPVARNDHDPVKHGFAVKRDRVGRDNRLGARYLRAQRCDDGLFDRAYPVEMQCATDRDGEIDECLLAHC